MKRKSEKFNDQDGWNGQYGDYNQWLNALESFTAEYGGGGELTIEDDEEGLKAYLDGDLIGNYSFSTRSGEITADADYYDKGSTDSLPFKKGDFVEAMDGETDEAVLGWIDGYDEVTKLYYVNTVEGEEMECEAVALTLIDEATGEVKGSSEGTFPDPSKGNDIPTLPFKPALTGKRAHKVWPDVKVGIENAIRNIKESINRYYKTDDVKDLEDARADLESIHSWMEEAIDTHKRENAQTKQSKEKLSIKYNSNSKFKKIFK